MTASVAAERSPTALRDVIGRLAWALVAVGAVALAVLKPGSIGTLVLYAALAQSWNIIGGLAGYASFGQVVFFGIGGYTAALAMDRLGLSFWVAFPIGGLAAGILGLVLGDLVLRVRGLYFAVATLALAQAAKNVISSWPGLAGQSGVLTIATVGLHQPTPRPSAAGFDALYVAVAAAATLTVGWIGRSRLGDAIAVIRDDEDLAGTLGIAVRPAKVIAFALSATVAGLAGGIYAFQVVSLSPSALFAPLLSVVMVAAVVAGGAGMFRPLRGAALLWLLAAGIGPLVPSMRDVLVAGLIVTVILVEERG
ncbi:MAG: branched-chain amino acid ABC transporter permease [Streptosporangiaceae bacterium]